MNTLWGPPSALGKSGGRFLRDGSLRTAPVLGRVGDFGAPSRGHGWKVLPLPSVPHRNQGRGPVSATLGWTRKRPQHT